MFSHKNSLLFYDHPTGNCHENVLGFIPPISLYSKTHFMKIALLLSLSFLCISVSAQTSYDLKELDSLVEHFFEKGAYRKSLYYSKLSLQKFQKQQGKNAIVPYTRYKELGILNMHAAQYDEAKQAFLKAKQLARRQYGRTSNQYANIIQNLGYLHKMKAQYGAAEKLYLQSLQIYSANEDTSQPEIITILNNLGTVYQHIGVFEKAEQFYTKAQRLRYIHLAPNHISLSTGLNNLAALAYQRGKYRKAEQLFLESQKRVIKRYGEDHIQVATSYLNLAKVYRAMARYELSKQLLLRAKDIWQRYLGEHHPSFAIALNALAGLYKEIGRYQEAKALYLQAQKIRRASFGENNPHYAKSIHNLASLYLEMGNYEKAEPLYWQSYRIWKSTLGPKHHYVAENLQNLGDLYRKAGDLERAEPLLQESKSIRTALVGIHNAVYASNLQSLGELYKAQKSYEKALPLLLEAKDLLNESLGASHPRFLHNLHELADLHFQRGQLELATRYCLQAIAHNCFDLAAVPCSIESLSILQLENLRFHSNIQANRSVSLLLQVLLRQYQKNEHRALLYKHFSLARTAMRINERMRNKLRAPEDQLRILRSNTTYIEQGIASALKLNEPKYIKEAFTFAELNKSMLLADALKGDRARALGDLPDSLAEQELKLQSRKAILQKKHYRASSAQEKEEINKALWSLELQIDDFLLSIKNKYPKYHALRYENITATIKDVQQLLEPSAALLEYFLTDSLVYAFTVQADDIQLKALAIPHGRLQRQVELLRHTLSDYKYIRVKPIKAFERYEEVAHWFYQYLVAPVLAKDSVDQLFVIPDGELGHLPFEAFLTQRAETPNYQGLDYLLHRYRISYHYSATLWKEQQLDSSPPPNAHMLAFAADYAGLSQQDLLRSASNTQAVQQLRPLGAARNEVKLLSESFEGYFAHGDDANEAQFKQLAPEYGVIHLAMHGLSHPSQPMLSSLAFSPSSDSLEDDFLQAYEIAQLPLQANLVVLSACETGYGKFEQGEGIISIARAFMYAGVPSLVVSLWQMSDASAAQVMRNFYQGLSEGEPLDAALQQAKQKYIKQAKGLLAHPAFWASFAQIGKNHSLMIQEKQQSPLFLRILWLTAVVLGLFGGWKNSRSNLST